MAIYPHVWNPISAIDVVRQSGDPHMLQFYARSMTLEGQPLSYGKFSRAAIAENAPLWDALYAQAEALLPRIPENRRQFFFVNMILQIQSSRLVNHWAKASVEGLDACKEGNYAAAAKHFEAAGNFMQGILPEREKASQGKWENWFRGEYQYVWGPNLWALKPAWHVKDSRTLTQMALLAADSKPTTPTLRLVPQPARLSVGGPAGKSHPCQVKMKKNYNPAKVKQATLFAVLDGIRNGDEGVVKINGQSFKIPRFYAGRQRGLLDLEIDPKLLKPGVNTIDYVLANDSKGHIKGYSVEEQVIYVR
jgi:hypothetical protein